MVIWTARFSKKAKAVLLLIVLALAAAVVFLLLGGKGAEAAPAVSLTSNEDRVAYLQSLGWTEETAISNIIIALKGYQFGTHARPVSIPKQGQKELPEQIFLREWAASPQALSIPEIQSFVDTVERGLCEEHNVTSVNKRGQTYLENIYFTLLERNAYVAKNSR